MQSVEARPTASTLRLDRCSLTFAGLAGAFVVAGGLVAAVDSAAPFAHGAWLAAYLVLVGGVAQLVLGLGRLALPGREPSPRLRRAQATLWSIGSLVVPAGVLGDVLAVVLLGSVVLLVALGGFAAGTGMGDAPARARGRTLAYRAVILALGASVVVGSVLAASGSGG